MTLVYPAELYPTALRASGVGFVTAISRLGSVVGTFWLPVALATHGLTFVMLIMCFTVAVGVVFSIFYAPETKHDSLILTHH